MNLEQLIKKIESYREEMVNAQISLCAKKAVSPANGGEGEYDKAQLVKRLVFFADKIEEYDAEDPEAKNGVRPNILAQVLGKDQSRSIWIVSHLDVVPEGDQSQWSTNPFEARVMDGKIYGRGTEDNQQGIVSSMFAAKAFKSLGIKPKYNLNLLFVSDEEMGSKYGMKFMVERYGDIFRKDDLYLVPDYGTPQGDVIEIGEKTVLWLKLQVKGKQVHASTPDKGINAHRVGAELLLNIDKTLHREYGAKNRFFSPPQSTFEPTKKETNVPNVNTIPGTDIFYFDCRILPQYDLDNILNRARGCAGEIESKYGVQVKLEVIQRSERSPMTDPESECVSLLASTIKKIYGVETRTMGIGGGTVAAFLRVHGCEVCTWQKKELVAHQPNEYCVIDNMVGDAKVFATFVF